MDSNFQVLIIIYIIIYGQQIIQTKTFKFCKFENEMPNAEE